MSKRRKKTFQKEVEQKRFGGGYGLNADAGLLKRVRECWKAQNEFYARKRHKC